MKPPLFTTFIFLILLFSNSAATAQPEWKWGVSNKIMHRPGFWGQLDAWPVAVDKSGNVFGAGYIDTESLSTTYGSISLPNVGHRVQLLVVKTDSNGHYSWAFGTQYGDAQPIGIVTDNSGNLYIYGTYVSDSCCVGTFTITNPMHYLMYFLFKLSPSGTVLWAKNVAPVENYSSYIGINKSGIGIDTSGNLYITGYFQFPTIAIGATTLSNSDVSGSSYDMFVAKYDGLGNVVWANSYGAIGFDLPLATAVSMSGNVYIAGFHQQIPFVIGGITLTGSNRFTCKIDKNGTLIWADSLDSKLFTDNMVTDAHENFYMVGTMGNYIGDMAILGRDTLVSTYNNNVFFAKFNANGNEIWARIEKSPNQAAGYAIAADNCGRVWLAGSMSDSVSFSGHKIFKPALSTDPAYVVSYDTSGNYINGFSLPSGGDDYIELAVDNKGHLYTCGDYEFTSMTFGTDTLSDPSLDSTGEALFIAKYTYDTIVCACMVSPTANFSFSGVPGPTISFTFTGTTPYDSIKWTFGDASSSPVVNPSHTFASMGVYNVCVTIYSTCIPEGQVSYCQNIDIGEGVTNIRHYNQLAIYPNPANNECTVHSELPFPPGSKVELCDLAGRLMSVHVLDGNSTSISLSGISPGIYLCRIVTPDNVSIRKLAVTK